MRRRGDGDGWVTCAQGHRHWGRFGAAGLLVHHRDGDDPRVLLQHRAAWSHHGDTWGVLGGARDSDECPTTAALREAGEEGGVDPSQVRVTGLYHDDHGGWTYSTVLAEAAVRLPARPTGGESEAVAWVAAGAVPGLPLHPGFAAAWPVLRTALVRLTVVVDAANVVGARADGWWRDRAAANRRLRDDLNAWAGTWLPDAALPADGERPRLDAWAPEVVLVVEGAARGVALDRPATPGVSVVAAGYGDDAVVAVVEERRRERPDDPALVVTADRELRRRCEALGSTVASPSWLLARLAAQPGA